MWDEGGEIYKGLKSQNIIVEADGDKYFQWPTNLMGKARIELQLEPNNISSENQLIRKFGYTVIFLVLVVYTVVFLFAYLKRLLMMAFLTMIAPLVAMTYPLDKLHDGSAQALNMWFKEYIFNLLIQPFHLLIYTILVGSAMELAQNNMLYAMAAIGFILPAEKLLRKFFGFDKASTVAGGSALGGALAMQGINQLRKLGSHAGKRNGEKQKGVSDKEEKEGSKPRFAKNETGYRELLGDGNNNANQGNQQSRENPRQGNEQLQENQGTPQQRMLDTYNEQFGTSDWDPQEANAMSQEAYKNEDNSMNYTADEYANILRDSGYGEDEIAEMMKDDPRYSDSNVGSTRENMEGTQVINGTTGSTTTDEMDRQQENMLNAMNQGNNTSVRDYKRSLGISKKRKIGLGALAVGKTVGRGLGKGIRYTAPKVAGLGIKGFYAAAAGMVGIAAGLASDDYSNIAKYGTAGLGAGWAGGSFAASQAGNIKNAVKAGTNGINNVRNEYNKLAYGKEAAEKIQEMKQLQKDMADKERRKLYQRKLKANKEDMDKIMNDVVDYRKAGVTDDKTIIKAMQAEGFGKERNSRERIMLAKVAQDVNGDSKKLSEIEKRLGKMNLKKEDIDKYSNAVRDMYDML